VLCSMDKKPPRCCMVVLVLMLVVMALGPAGLWCEQRVGAEGRWRWAHQLFTATCRECTQLSPRRLGRPHAAISRPRQATSLLQCTGSAPLEGGVGYPTAGQLRMMGKSHPNSALLNLGPPTDVIPFKM
jgi:hypothetical protein